MSYWYGGLDYQLRGFDVIESPSKLSKKHLRKRGGYIGLLGPYTSEQEMQQVIRQIGMQVKHARRMKNNPALQAIDTTGAVEIYEDIHAIEAKKNKRSLWPNENFRHDFTRRKTKIFGLKNGNLLIVGNKRLWKMFKYRKENAQ